MHADSRRGARPGVASLRSSATDLASIVTIEEMTVVIREIFSLPDP